MRPRMVMAAAFSATALCCPPAAHGDPPAFPDVDHFTPVTAQDFTVRLPLHPHDPTEALYFLTPQGIPCHFLTGAVACAGTVPGVLPADAAPFTTVSTADGIHSATSTSYVNGTIQGLPIQTLPAMHSLTGGGAICGVDDAGATACRDFSGRGFVISPRGTTWLPHV
jgi:hypothetical protein